MIGLYKKQEAPSPKKVIHLPEEKNVLEKKEDPVV